MIIKLDRDSRDLQKIEPLIGKQLDLSQKFKNHKYGSNLYTLRSISLEDSMGVDVPSENSRCNFEKFEKGMLLRINDHQKLVGFVLSSDVVEEISITRGKEKVFPLSPSGLLIWFGMTRETVKKHRFFSGGFYHERFRLEIKTKSEKLILDSNDSNYSKEKAYFIESVLKQKLTIVE